jgi:hypothetical protein
MVHSGTSVGMYHWWFDECLISHRGLLTMALSCSENMPNLWDRTARSWRFSLYVTRMFFNGLCHLDQLTMILLCSRTMDNVWAGRTISALQRVSFAHSVAIFFAAGTDWWLCINYAKYLGLDCVMSALQDVSRAKDFTMAIVTQTSWLICSRVLVICRNPGSGLLDVGTSGRKHCERFCRGHCHADLLTFVLLWSQNMPIIWVRAWCRLQYVSNVTNQQMPQGPTDPCVYLRVEYVEFWGNLHFRHFAVCKDPVCF